MENQQLTAEQAIQAFGAASVADDTAAKEVLRGRSLADVLDAHARLGKNRMVAIFTATVTGHLDMMIYSAEQDGPSFEYEVRGNELTVLDAELPAGHERQHYRPVELWRGTLEGIVREYGLRGSWQYRITLRAARPEYRVQAEMQEFDEAKLGLVARLEMTPERDNCVFMEVTSLAKR